MDGAQYVSQVRTGLGDRTGEGFLGRRTRTSKLTSPHVTRVHSRKPRQDTNSVEVTIGFHSEVREILSLVRGRTTKREVDRGRFPGSCAHELNLLDQTDTHTHPSDMRQCTLTPRTYSLYSVYTHITQMWYPTVFPTSLTNH